MLSLEGAKPMTVWKCQIYGLLALLTLFGCASYSLAQSDAPLSSNCLPYSLQPEKSISLSTQQLSHIITKWGSQSNDCCNKDNDSCCFKINIAFAENHKDDQRNPFILIFPSSSSYFYDEFRSEILKPHLSD